ncbi:MAG: MBL fold metallo-hydrolase [Lachnospiraceae bacterium]|nr:MBL fold metallo-hydrolase [Lachnospiraceae bacterium]
MHIHYLFHSGFLAETANCYYVFDFYRGELPLLQKTKPVLVFSSHRHPDHYNQEIFNLLKRQGMEQITAVLSKDIPKEAYPQDVPVIRVTFHEQYDLPYGCQLKTLLSTDEGVAFLLRCPEGTLYHAGDLNDWVWAEESEQYNKQMTGSYRHEIDLLKDEKIDTAFLPLDPRQEKDYARGILYFLKQIKVGRIFPMHYWEQPEIITRFIHEYPQYREIIMYTEDYR